MKDTKQTKSQADIWIDNLEKQFTKKGLNKKLNQPTPTGNFVYIPRNHMLNSLRNKKLSTNADINK